MVYLIDMAKAFWETLGGMAPYLLFGFFVAGFLSVVVSAETVERHLGSRGLWSIMKASIFGVPLPLCSCGVIPVAASLRRHGASRGATTAFLLSTPQTGVDSILVTLSLLGPVFAIFRPIAAFVTGILGGALVGLFGESRGRAAAAEPVCTDACCSYSPADGKFRRMMKYGFVTLPRDIGKSLLLGLAIAAVLSIFVPPHLFAGRLGSGVTGMLVMMALGIPIYVCATASVPIAAILILEKNVSAGAALVFLMTGPATNAASITTIWRIMGRRTAILYLVSVAGSALGAGALLDLIFRHPGVPQVSGMTEMLPVYVKIPAALALLAVILAAVFSRERAHEEEKHMSHEHEDTGEKVVIRVGGMTCSHCAAAVERALRECAGVSNVQVSLERGEATVSGREVDHKCLTDAVVSVGYTVEGQPG